MSNGRPKTSSKSTLHFLAGLGSGVLSAVLLQPIDLLKTRVQQSASHSLFVALAEIRSAPHLVPALWRGTIPSALRMGFGSAIYFTSLNVIRLQAATVASLRAPIPNDDPTSSAATTKEPRTTARPLSSSPSTLSNTGNLLAGASARAFAGLVLMPLTVLKVRYESSFHKYPNLLSALLAIYANRGPRGFFAGFGATVIRDVPYAGLYVLFYEQAKRRLSTLALGSWASLTDPFRTAAVNFASGVLAATVCSFVSNPFDAVKTRIQLCPADYVNTWQAARRMVAEEGVRSLLDGLALRMARKAASSALTWTVYEELVRRAELAWAVGGGEVRERGL